MYEVKQTKQNKTKKTDGLLYEGEKNTMFIYFHARD